MIVAQEKPNYSYVEQPTQTQIRWSRPQPGMGRRTRILLTALVVGTFVLGVALNLYCARVVQLGYKAAMLKAEIARLEAENQNLEVAIGRLDSLERVEAAAVTQLGMVQPSKENVLFVAVNPAAMPDQDLLQDDKEAKPSTIQKEPGNLADARYESKGLLETLVRIVCQWEAKVRAG